MAEDRDWTLPGAIGRWWAEHSLLDGLVEDLTRALDAHRHQGALEAADALCDALFAHFLLEEDVYFPLLLRASPDHARSVQSARSGHQRIREQLEELRSALERGEPEAARRALGPVLDLFRQHEEQEGDMVARLVEVVQARGAQPGPT